MPPEQLADPTFGARLLPEIRSAVVQGWKFGLFARNPNAKTRLQHLAEIYPVKKSYNEAYNLARRQARALKQNLKEE